MNNLLKASGLLLMWGLFYAAVNAGIAEQEIQKTAKATKEMESDIPAAVQIQLGLLRTEVDASIASLSNVLDKQLSESNHQLALTRQDTLAKVGMAVDHLNTTLDAATNAVGSLNKTVVDADDVVSDPEVKKTLHSARMTVDAAGTAAVHFEGMVNTVDTEFPKLVDSFVATSLSAQSTAGSVQSMAASGKGLVDSYLKPRKWYIRLRDASVDGGFRIIGYWL